MKTLRIFLLLVFFTQGFAAIQTEPAEFMTPRDLLRNDGPSNINLHNSRNSATTVYGLYIYQYAFVPRGQSCSSPSVIYPSVDLPGNNAGGAFVTPITLNAGKTAAIGSNYLYNMIYEAIYYVRINIVGSPPGCALPGCSWLAEPATYDWCIYLGALAPVSTSPGFTSNISPWGTSPSGPGFDYNLINSFIYLGPIACNDQTLTCTVRNQQTQSF